MARRVIEWRLIPGFPAYEVSSAGAVRFSDMPRFGRGARPAPGKLLRPSIYKEGYLYYRLRKNLKEVGMFGHVAVALAFIGPRPSPKHQVAHWDGDEQNNDYRNLRWATSKENSADKKRHGTEPRGEKHHSTKLSDDGVRRLRRLSKTKSLDELSAIFKLHPVTCMRIAKRERRGDVV